LQLGRAALIELGQKSWYPAPVEVPGLAAFNTPFEDMTVNSYLVFDSKAGQAAAFDTGSTAAGMLEFIKERQLTLAFIFLTHSHPDHVADLKRLETATGAPAYVGENEHCTGRNRSPPGKFSGWAA
jgi:hydroxyacylglutathione hydrolase